MKNKKFFKLVVLLVCIAFSSPAMAQFDLKKAISGAVKMAQAVTLTDEQMSEYVKEYITWMDAHNQVCADDNAYTLRLKKLTEGLGDADGIPLNFKVYYVKDVNAFACADGSVRVFSSLMDIMSDEELLGVIGHEIGHVAHRDSKKGFRTALLTSALKDGVASQGGKLAELTDSQLGSLTEALVNARYSQKQECEADDYGYEFLKKAGKNPWSMALSFQKLKELSGRFIAGARLPGGGKRLAHRQVAVRIDDLHPGQRQTFAKGELPQREGAGDEDRMRQALLLQIMRRLQHADVQRIREHHPGGGAQRQFATLVNDHLHLPAAAVAA